MVGRFACEELVREALAHEDLYARPGILGRFSCLLGAFLMGVGLLAIFNLDSLIFGAPLRSPPAPGPRSFGVDDAGFGREAVPLSGLGYGGFGVGSDFGSASSLADEEIERMTLDYSLLALCVTGIALCVLQPFARALSGQWGPPWLGSAPWAALGRPSQPPGADALLGPAAAGPGGGFFSGGALRGRIIDVKPGELRGAQAGSFAGGFSGGFFGGGGGGWLQGAGQGDWMGAAAPGATTWGGSSGSWSSPVPSPYSSTAPGLPGVPASAGAWPPLGAGLSGGQGHAGGALPTEADVVDTYAAFGVELQQWTPALLAFIDREVVGNLVQMLDESDQTWLQALAPRGWRLTFEAPRLAYPGVGPSAQELSIFDRHLPRPICDDPRAVELWKRRQTLEAYLMHPSFEPAQRSYVLERLREWRQRGLQNCMRAEFRPSDQLPTDAHILENLLFKMLNFHMDFCSCFVTAGPSPPLSKHLGQSPTAYLRQVTDQAVFPKPAPHYEVVTLHKTWRIRPGNSNLLEALALLLQALRRHSHSYQSFPQSLRSAVESAAATSAPARTFSWF